MRKSMRKNIRTNMKASMKSNIKKTFHVLKVAFKASKMYIFILLFLAVLNSILPFIGIIYSLRIIDALIDGLERGIILNYIYVMVLLTFIFGILVKILEYLKTIYTVKMQDNLDNKILIKTFTLDYEQIEENETMKLLKKAEEGSSSSGGIENYCESVIIQSFSSILSIIYALTLLIGLIIVKEVPDLSLFGKILNNPLTGLIIVLTIIVSCLISFKVMKLDNNESYKAMMGNIDGNRKFTYFFSLCCDYMYGKDIRIFGMQKMIYGEMTSSKYSVDKIWREYSNKNIKYRTILSALSKLVSLVSYLYVGMKAIYKLISIGSVVSYVSSITLLNNSITKIFWSFSEISLMNNYLDNYFKYLELESKNKYGNRNLDIKDNVKIEFVNLSFKYPHQEKYILKNINLSIEPQKKIAIVGSNGAGKTTLIKLLCRLYQPTEGKILINDIPIEEFTKESCYDLFSIVFQDFKLFSYSIKDNVCCGQIADEEKAYECLEKAGIKERVLKMKKQINTFIYEKNKEEGVEISGGEAQKIAIARALYKDSSIVILDEPTSALDPRSEAEIYEKFQYLVNNKTAIFISHRMSSCRFCDEIVVLDEGMIKEKGSHSELMKANNIYAKMWNAQSQYYNI